MNYDNRFRDLIADIKADKSIIQPWRNKAIGRIDEAQALLEKGQRMSYMKEPPGAAETSELNGSLGSQCICPEGGTHARCPLHGTMR